MNFPVLNFVVDWKLLLLLDCDELCTTLTKMITTTEMNLIIFIFLISISFCSLFCMISELLIFSVSRLCSKLLSWLLWLKYEVFFSDCW